MHYADGTEAKMHDAVRSAPKDIPASTGGIFTFEEMIGVVVHGQPAQEACNINVRVFAKRYITPLGTSAWLPHTDSYPQLFQSKELLLVAR